MDIRRIAINAVTEIIEITIFQTDYKGQVAKRINEKMPLATVKGFRKGAVPKDLVEKQYGKSIKEEEVKKVVDLALERFITSERLNLLGTPLPVQKEIFNWDLENLTFQYEIGLVPNFTLDLDAKTNVTKYIISGRLVVRMIDTGSKTGISTDDFFEIRRGMTPMSRGRREWN